MTYVLDVSCEKERVTGSYESITNTLSVIRMGLEPMTYCLEGSCLEGSFLMHYRRLIISMLMNTLKNRGQL